MDLAFGDLDPKEASELEARAQSDPEAAKLVAAYREISSGLRGLRDVPEDQLSNERLRSAILEQGLKPKSTPGGVWGWLWMPPVACALAFGLIMLRGRTAPSAPRIVSNFDVPSAQKPAGDNDVPLIVRLPHQTPVAATKPKQAVKQAAERPNEDFRVAAWRRHARERRRSAPEKSPYYAMASSPGTVFAGNIVVPLSVKPSSDGTSADVSTDPQTGSTQVVVHEQAKPPSAGPIILIDQQRDSATGAQKATEVSTPDNVIVGG